MGYLNFLVALAYAVWLVINGRRSAGVPARHWSMCAAPALSSHLCKARIDLFTRSFAAAFRFSMRAKEHGGIVSDGTSAVCW